MVVGRAVAIDAVKAVQHVAAHMGIVKGLMADDEHRLGGILFITGLHLGLKPRKLLLTHIHGVLQAQLSIEHEEGVAAQSLGVVQGILCLSGHEAAVMTGIQSLGRVPVGEGTVGVGIPVAAGAAYVVVAQQDQRIIRADGIILAGGHKESIELTFLAVVGEVSRVDKANVAVCIEGGHKLHTGNIGLGILAAPVADMHVTHQMEAGFQLSVIRLLLFVSSQEQLGFIPRSKFLAGKAELVTVFSRDGKGNFFGPRRKILKQGRHVNGNHPEVLCRVKSAGIRHSSRVVSAIGDLGLAVPGDTAVAAVKIVPLVANAFRPLAVGQGHADSSAVHVGSQIFIVHQGKLRFAQRFRHLTVQGKAHIADLAVVAATAGHVLTKKSAILMVHDPDVLPVAVVAARLVAPGLHVGVGAGRNPLTVQNLAGAVAQRPQGLIVKGHYDDLAAVAVVAVLHFLLHVDHGEGHSLYLAVLNVDVGPLDLGPLVDRAVFIAQEVFAGTVSSAGMHPPLVDSIFRGQIKGILGVPAVDHAVIEAIGIPDHRIFHVSVASQAGDLIPDILVDHFPGTEHAVRNRNVALPVTGNIRVFRRENNADVGQVEISVCLFILHLLILMDLHLAGKIPRSIQAVGNKDTALKTVSVGIAQDNGIAHFLAVEHLAVLQLKGKDVVPVAVFILGPHQALFLVRSIEIVAGGIDRLRAGPSPVSVALLPFAGEHIIFSGDVILDDRAVPVAIPGSFGALHTDQRIFQTVGLIPGAHFLRAPTVLRQSVFIHNGHREKTIHKLSGFFRRLCLHTRNQRGAYKKSGQGCTDTAFFHTITFSVASVAKRERAASPMLSNFT